jgi:hypothetical protein
VDGVLARSIENRGHWWGGGLLIWHDFKSTTTILAPDPGG